MALLAPQSLVDKWYHTDSWVYKNFSFMFNNPLWDNRVPRGFSLCPYFWLSLFSLFIVRPFVYTLLAFRAVVKFLSLTKALGAIDRFIVTTIYRQKDSSFLSHSPAGAFSFLNLIFAAVIASAVYFGSGGAVFLFKVYSHYNCLSLLFLPLLVAVTMVSCMIYAGTHKSYTHGGRIQQRCKVEYYVYAVALFSVIVATILHPSEAVAVLKECVWALRVISLNLWDFAKVCWFGVGHGFVWVGHIFSGLFQSGINAAAASIKWVIGSLIALGAISLIGYQLSKPPVVDPKKQALLLEKQQAESRRRTAISHIDYYDDRYGNSDFWTKFFATHKLPEFEALVNINRSGNSTGYNEAARLAWEKAKVIIEAEREVRRKAEAAEQLRRDAWDKKCGVVSSKVAAVLKALWWIPSTVLRYPAKGLKWVVVQSATFIALLWNLFWAWKKGACPYKQFVDPTTLPGGKNEPLAHVVDRAANKPRRRNQKTGKMNLTPDNE